MSVTEAVLEYLKSRPGKPFGAKSLLHLGSRAAVDQALSRLYRRGVIERVARGVYLFPEASRFGPKLPALSAFLASQSEQLGESIVPSEAGRSESPGAHAPGPRSSSLAGGEVKATEMGKSDGRAEEGPT